MCLSENGSSLFENGSNLCGIGSSMFICGRWCVVCESTSTCKLVGVGPGYLVYTGCPKKKGDPK